METRIDKCFHAVKAFLKSIFVKTVLCAASVSIISSSESRRRADVAVIQESPEALHARQTAVTVK